jgi:hypothetical protein
VSSISGGATPIVAVGPPNDSQITLPVAGDYFIQFQMNRRTNNNQAALRVYTGANCTATAENIVGDVAVQSAPVAAQGIIRTTAANTTIQICQKANQTITPQAWTGGGITGMLTVMRLN